MKRTCCLNLWFYQRHMVALSSNLWYCSINHSHRDYLYPSHKHLTAAFLFEMSFSHSGSGGFEHIAVKMTHRFSKSNDFTGAIFRFCCFVPCIPVCWPTSFISPAWFSPAGAWPAPFFFDYSVCWQKSCTNPVLWHYFVCFYSCPMVVLGGSGSPSRPLTC